MSLVEQDVFHVANGGAAGRRAMHESHVLGAKVVGGEALATQVTVAFSRYANAFVHFTPRVPEDAVVHYIPYAPSVCHTACKDVPTDIVERDGRFERAEAVRNKPVPP